MKNQLNARVSDQISERIDQLKTWLNESQTGVVTTAINQLFEIERNKRMDMKTLTENVARAVARLQADGIEGWGLGNPDPKAFDLVVTRPAHGCTSETCNHNSHDPAAPTYKLIPKFGRFVTLGDEMESDETMVTYLTFIADDIDGTSRFYRFTEPRHFWASIRQIDADDVPDWSLASLAKN